MNLLRTKILLLSLLLPNWAQAEAPLFFREDWKESPFALPITPDHVSNPIVRMETHGPGKLGIKKSHHAEIENDPFYVWSGMCELNWALSLRKNGHLVDMSDDNAMVRWRSRQSGDRALHLLIKLPGEHWFISEQSDGEQEWHDHEFRISDLTWRHFSIIKAQSVGDKVATPKLDRIEQVGFTDQNPGKGTPASSRLDWIEVYGKSITAPAKAPPAVKPLRVKPILPKNVEEHLNLVYTNTGSRDLTLDLYKPTGSDDPHPAVIFIHGGGWYKGDPSSYTAMAQQLAARGYVTLNIFYRLSGEASFPAAIQDCKAAVRWARANAKTYSIAAHRIGSVGGSAGGHLSGLLATSGDSKHHGSGGSHESYSDKIQACVVMAGTMDLTTAEARQSASSDPRQRMITFIGGSWEESKQQYVDASPITHVSANTPPMLFMDGEFDSPGTRYPEMIEKLDALGIYHQSHVIPDAPHPFWTSHPFFDPALDILAAFFDKTLKMQSK